MTIPFTQYIRPYGRKALTEYETDSEAIDRLAAEIIEAGGRFEAEVLTTGEVSVTCVASLPDPTRPGKTYESDIAIAVCKNANMPVKTAVESIVAQAARRLGIK